MNLPENPPSTGILEVFCDGGCWGNPGPGAWAFVIRTPEGIWEQGDWMAQTTNNQMEWEACQRAQAFINAQNWKFEEVRLYLDSQVTLHRLTRQGLSSKWKLFYVPGHRGIGGNERVNQIVTWILKNQQPWIKRWSLGEYPWNLDVGLPWAQAWQGQLTKKPSLKPRYLVWTDTQHWVLESWDQAQLTQKNHPGSRVKKIFHEDEIALVLGQTHKSLKN